MRQAGGALPSGTVTFVFADVEGSTFLLKRLASDSPSLSTCASTSCGPRSPGTAVRW
jgi:hypothetical protein